jgi:hypothetical protein
MCSENVTRWRKSSETATALFIGELGPHPGLFKYRL